MHVRKELNSRRICFEIQRSPLFMALFWNPNMAAMTSCENAPFIVIIYDLFTSLSGRWLVGWIGVMRTCMKRGGGEGRGDGVEIVQ